MGNCLFSECPFWEHGCTIDGDACPMEDPDECPMHDEEEMEVD